MNLHTQHILEFDKIIERLAGLAQSEPGHELCVRLKPVTDLVEVEKRQAVTQAAVQVLLTQGTPPLIGITDIRPSASRTVAGSVLSCTELLRIAALLRGAARLRGFVPDEDTANIVFLTMLRLVPLPDLEQAISAAVIGEDELHDRASPELYSIRRRIREAQSKIKEILDKVIRSHSRVLQEQLVTLRGDRYVVPVRAEYRNELPGIVHDVSSSGSTVFVEPMAVVEANNRIRELKSDERTEIERILAMLSAQVAENESDLSEDVHLMSLLDFQIAKAQFALDLSASQPILNQEGRIVLRGARHPLIPPDQVVPLDFHIGMEFETLVITGPNTGGKTVALKTCGLLTLMALSGLQIPARERSEISVFDDILADIGDEQSIEQSLSTFSSHMSNLVHITSHAATGTLVLLDELGSGTDPSEGAALAIAVLDFLRSRGCITVATTHYKELKGYAMETAGVENACCEFDTDTLQPTYRLLIGIPGVSNAFVISAKLGLDPEIIEMARTCLTEEGLRFEELLHDVEKSHTQSRRMRDEASALRASAQSDKEQAESMRDDVAGKRAEILQKAREEARAELVSYTADVENLVKEIRNAMRENNLTDAETGAMSARQMIRESLRNVEGEIGRETLNAFDSSEVPEQIENGKRYYAASIGFEGRVVSGPDNKDNYVLVDGALKVTVPRSTLRVPVSNRKKKSAGRTPVNSSPGTRKRGKKDAPGPSRAMTFQPEVKLLGMTADEALMALDKYLDDAVLSGTENIRIVHGKGTGVLRAAVTRFLKSDNRIKAYRLGGYGEGDTGVTLAEMK